MEHAPVLLKECIDGLNIKPGGVYVDGTLGRGGHTAEIAKRLGSGKIIAIDRDIEAIRESEQELSLYRGIIHYIHGNFKDIAQIIDTEGEEQVDGMLFDLGVSSPQLDSTLRGFSYMHDSPLDMRMDLSERLTAFEVVNKWPEENLSSLFFEYGEERYSKLIARAIVKQRSVSEIKSTFGLNEVIFSALPAAARRENQHPAKRCYQALRIAINNELESISDMLESAPGVLKSGARICVISFHSLEDRIVKNAFSKGAAGCVCPKDFPVCVCGVRPTLSVITKRPIIPGKDEVDINPRSRSAKLRIAQRV